MRHILLAATIVATLVAPAAARAPQGQRPAAAAKPDEGPPQDGARALQNAYRLAQASDVHKQEILDEMRRLGFGELIPPAYIPEMTENARRLNIDFVELLFWQTSAPFAGVRTDDFEAIAMASRLMHATSPNLPR